MSEGRRILIAGGGIAGLSAALAVAAAGWTAEIFEQADRIEEFGAGLQLTPNASEALARLGLAEPVAAAAFEPAHLNILSRSGRLLLSAPLGPAFAAKYGHPYRVIHRGDLIGLLADAVRGHPAISVRLSHRAEDFAADAGGATVTVAVDGRRQDFRGAGLIGADGLRSAIRRRIVGDGDPRPSGCVAWRAIAEGTAGRGSRLTRDVCIWLGSGAHVVTYPLRGASLVNIVAVTRAGWEGTGWNAGADGAQILRRFEGWPAPLLEVMAAAPAWRAWSLADRVPAARWGDGPVTLTGDAAHPVLPFAGQGAALALEDAATLGRCLDRHAALDAAFAAFQAARRSRAAAIWSFSRRNGAFYHAPAPVAAARDMALRAMPPSRLMERQRWIYRWTA